MSSNASIRVGVAGVGRGRSFMRSAKATGMTLVAICDTWEERLKEVGQDLGVTTYTDYDAFLDHDLDAVVLANYFHEHAPFAVKALTAGKHVMSECAACHTLEQEDKAIGPQLVDIGLRYKRLELLESVVKPTAKIAQGFTTQVIATEDGLTHTGFVTREAGDELDIRTAEGKTVVIRKESIEARKDSKNSVMPEGLVNNLTVKELSSLIAYLQSGGKADDPVSK